MIKSSRVPAVIQECDNFATKIASDSDHSWQLLSQSRGFRKTQITGASHQYNTMKLLLKSAFLISLGTAMAASSAMGAFTFTNGDMILGFQATGGIGSTINVYFNLGSGTAARNNPALGLLGNISTALSSAYGSSWYTRTDLQFGVLGNLNFAPNTGIGSQAAVNGDPSCSFYVSTPSTLPQLGILYANGTLGLGVSGLGNAGVKLSGMEGVLGSSLNYTTSAANEAVINSAGASQAITDNSWTTLVPSSGSALTVFTGGIQQSFGQGGTATYADIQRILSTNTGANPTGLIAGGTYETTLSIGSNGNISLIPEPSSVLLSSMAGLALVFRRRRNA